MKFKITSGSAFAAILFCSLTGSKTIVQAQAKPNIVVILADDLGFSDIGAFGSEIHTPTLDSLANNGLKLTQFYNAGRCCPSRAALLTGLYPHEAGLGDMVQDKGSEAYQGYLSKHSVTFAQLLKQHGYQTIVSGKWHVGLVPSAWAVNRGFDKSFVLQNNGSSYFNSKPLYNDGRTITFLLNGHPIERQDTSTYLTTAITNFAIKSLDEIKQNPNPFLLYVAYNAPHWPIQALPQDIEKYKGKYLQGWDSLRVQRYRKLVQLGIIKKEWDLSPRYKNAPAWSSLSDTEKARWDIRMAIYAAMIDRMDAEIARILDKIREIKRDNNTLVLFMSDNGGSADEPQQWAYVEQKRAEPGSVNDIDGIEPPWGNAANTPFRLFKKNTHEGGIASPFIAYFPGKIKAGNSSNQPAHIIDVLPTLLDYAGLKYPENDAGNVLKPLSGKSLRSFLENSNKRLVKRKIYWEHEGSRAIRVGNWKLVAEINESWELYNLSKDRTEVHNLASKYPEKVKKMEARYLKWASSVGVKNWNEIK